jgi:glycerol-3-phosphate dehydrogenase
VWPGARSGGQQAGNGHPVVNDPARASTRLGPAERAAALEALAGAELQVLVVGGGVVGAGVALDAVSRGLTVGLVEARDFGSGTSSRSSKLIHGGLRYLEQLNVGLVREALSERSLLLQRLAPHLVRPVSFLFPFASHWERAYVGAGVAAYDALGLSVGQARGLPGHRQLTRRGALRLAPAPTASSRCGIPGTRSPGRRDCTSPASSISCTGTAR